MQSSETDAQDSILGEVRRGPKDKPSCIREWTVHGCGGDTGLPKQRNAFRVSYPEHLMITQDLNEISQQASIRVSLGKPLSPPFPQAPGQLLGKVL